MPSFPISPPIALLFLPCYCPYVPPSVSMFVGAPPRPYSPPISLLFGCFSFFCGGRENKITQIQNQPLM